MDLYNHSTPISIKLPIFYTRKFEQWKFKIQQYLQHEHYAVWEVIEFGDSYKATPDETAKDKGLTGEVSSSTKKKGRTVAITTKDMQKRKMMSRQELLYCWISLMNIKSAEHQGVKTEGRESYKKDPKVEEPVPKAMIAIDGFGVIWLRKIKLQRIMFLWSMKKKKNTKNLNAKISKLNEELSDCETDLYNYKRDYTRTTPRIDVSKSVSKEQEERWKSNNPSFFEQGGSSGNVVLKPMIKFVKESGCPNAIKVNNTENTRKPTVNYAEMILRKFITEIENLKDLNVKIIKSDNRGEFRNKETDELYSRKGIKREFSNARTPQQNGVTERRNRTLIEATRTMLADAKLPVTFWAEAVNTSCYVQNMVLVIKPHNKTPYELFNERSPTIRFLRPFGCHVMIHNTLDHLGKFDAKGEEGTREDVHQSVKEKESPLRFSAFPNWFYEAQMVTSNETAKKDDAILNKNAL
nr:ribonuclease H-like domain-containing protein [Tanacetum cinerariifolium]